MERKRLLGVYDDSEKGEIGPLCEALYTLCYTFRCLFITRGEIQGYWAVMFVNTSAYATKNKR